MTLNSQQKKEPVREIRASLCDICKYSSTRGSKQPITKQHLAFLEGYTALLDYLDSEKTDGFEIVASCSSCAGNGATETPPVGLLDKPTHYGNNRGH